ncbi:alginate export family protein [Rhodocytophaga rosea]|uniref:Alginate export family protein n=1 Tax=Rhodocytophaga rosea TaxID=2704465 RepID=A0A6C0GGA3_9BACT|nr:alginate export family protein [Rhodocytophaga rosea]QHT66939.1 alginate export family protein [Rhodocytophaga rosea]
MQKKLHSQLLSGLVFLLLYCNTAQAQFSLTGQLRTRSELRDGQGTLSGKGAVPAFFTSQRTRLNFGYTGHRFKLFTAVQDVRVWGQDASSINRNTLDANDGLMIHEAWGEIMLLDTSASIENLSLKIGRQELVYDDVRLLGNLDWLQQARRHDMALLKLEDHGWMAHLGVAFNQNRELKAGSVYNGTPTGYTAGTNGIGTLYKSMQFVYLGRKFPTGNASFLFLKDDFNKYHLEETSKVYDRGVWSRLTTGAYISTNVFKKLSLTASAYYQTGKDKDGNKLNAYLLSAYTLYPVSKKLNIGPGIDYTSGNNATSTGTTNRQFDPLYGTPHKFWGGMDYFYVADGFGKNGLVDYYLRGRYKASAKLLISVDAHQFTASNKVLSGDGIELDRNFGTELDLIATYNLTKIITIEGGYSNFFATPTLASSGVKNVANADLQANWAYLMINIKPDFLNK